ncbi:MAG: LuxR C-terminal-related transcriptional regulator [Pseudonocardia sp.]|nr:LuxR C-terminal-related transcriptional regulator [Pseudonocardia sp.]
MGDRDVAPATATIPPLLERDRDLDALAAWAAEARRIGRVVLVGGEAGAGKSALLRAFRDALPTRTPVFEGACEALSTPRPLAPLLDVAARSGGPLARAVAAGAEPVELFGELLAMVARRPGSVLIVEDLHWADDATLDLLRFVSRRIGELPALAVATFRDDEIGAGHPLRVLLGDIAASRSVSRLALAPLSAAAVAELAAGSELDPHLLFAQTGGNPFYVTEVLAAGTSGVPETVRDAVLARSARLPAPAHRALEAAAVVGSPAELEPLRAVAGADASQLDECMAAGLLRAEVGAVAFRHELARVAVEEAIPPARRSELHAAALRHLAPRGAAAATLAHHAAAAGDRAATRAFAERAATDAARLGSHREAAAQYRRALQALDPVDHAARARLLVRCSEECALSDQTAEATACAEEALRLWRSLGDRLREGDSLRWLGRLAWQSDRAADADRLGREAIDLLERLPPGPELARAYAALAQRRAVNQSLDPAQPFAERALGLAEALGEAEIAAQATIDLGLIRGLRHEAQGVKQMEEGVRRARDVGSDDHAARGLFHLGRLDWQFRRFTEAERRLRATEAFCLERGVEFWRDYALTLRADIRLDLGDWAVAEEIGREVWRRTTPASPTVRTVHVSAVLGILHARRGTADPENLLAGATTRATPVPNLAVHFGVAAWSAEAAWLSGRLGCAVAGLRAARQIARIDRFDGGWELAELNWWLHLAGEPDAAAEGVGPFVAQIAGDWRAAAAEWEALGQPYHRAQALAQAAAEEPLRDALGICHDLGAVPLARRITRRLRALGVRSIPRLPGPAAVGNPARLTARERDVLALLIDGLRDREIADRLVISERTVHHHVAAILRKLDAPSRTAAVAAAARLGLPKDG